MVRIRGWGREGNGFEKSDLKREGENVKRGQKGQNER